MSYQKKYFKMSPESEKCYKQLEKKSGEEMALKYAKDEDKFLKYKIDMMVVYFVTDKCEDAEKVLDEMKKCHTKMEKKYKTPLKHHEKSIKEVERHVTK